MRASTILILLVASVGPALASERTDKIFIQGNPAGTQTVNEEPAGVTRVEYSYNDRGRGDHIVATWNSMPPGCRPNTRVAATIT